MGGRVAFSVSKAQGPREVKIVEQGRKGCPTKSDSSKAMR